MLVAIQVSLSYHLVMAMTLRLSDELDAALTAMAQREGISKSEAAVRSISERAARINRADLIRRYALEIIDEDRELLDRLAQ